jgi:Zn-dependent protease with chaperone function
MDIDFAAYVARRRQASPGGPGEGYAYVGDLRVRRALQTVRPVELAVAHTVKLAQSFLNSELLGGAVKVGPQQFPRLHEIAGACAARLGISRPTVYIVPRIDAINAATYGTEDDAFIMVHSATLDYFDDAELTFIIGHECGHIQNNHVVYLTTLHMLTQMAHALLGVVLAPLVYPATLALQSWARAGEITCDRAGLLCCRDLRVGMRAFVKLALGNKRLFDELNFDAYFDQLREGKQAGVGRLGELGRSHPYLPKRVEALRIFSESALYRGALGEAGGLGREELERQTVDLVKVV